MIERFADAEQGGFFQTSSDHEQLVARRKELDDNPIPSGASSAAFGLLRLAALTGEASYEERAVGVLRLAGALAPRHPQGFGHLLQALDFHLATVREVALVGADTHALERVVRGAFRPHAVLAGGDGADAAASRCSRDARRSTAARPPTSASVSPAGSPSASPTSSRRCSPHPPDALEHPGRMGSLFAFVAGRRTKWLVALHLARAPSSGRSPPTCPGKFADAEKNESTSFLPGDAESTKALEVTTDLEGGELAPLVIVYHRDGGLTAADRRVIARDRAVFNRKQLRATSPFARPVFSEDRERRARHRADHERRRGRDDPRPGRRGARAHGEPRRRPGDEGHRRRRLLRRRDQGLRVDQRHAAAARRSLLVLFLLILIYRSPIFWFFPILAVGVRRGRHAQRSATG